METEEDRQIMREKQTWRQSETESDRKQAQRDRQTEAETESDVGRAISAEDNPTDLPRRVKAKPGKVYRERSRTSIRAGVCRRLVV